MKINKDKIKDFKIFNNINNDGIELFLNKMQLKSYQENEIIMHEGDKGNSILLLLNGEISITKALTLPTNKKNDTLNKAELSINDNREKEIIRCNAENNIIIGEISLFSKKNERTATVKALTNCNIAYLEKDDFFEICNQNTEIGYKAINNLTQIITQRLIDTNHQVLKLTTAFSLIVDN